MAWYDGVVQGLIWIAVMICTFHCWKGYCLTAAQQEGTTRTRNTTTEQPETTSAAQASDGVDPALLRSEVLNTIFPEQKIDNNTSLMYDPESNNYQWTTNKCAEAACSICLENYEPGDVTISSQCSHVFHRDCILGWLKQHDECPECRRVMWDDDVYKLLEVDIRASLVVQE